MTKKPIWGTIEFVAASLALIGAVFGSSIAERISPARPVEERIADTVVRVRDAVVAKLKDRNAKIAGRNERASLHERFFLGSLAMGALGVISSGISYSRREDKRLAIAAGSVAVVSLAWQILMLAIGALAVLVIIAVVSATLGGTAPG